MAPCCRHLDILIAFLQQEKGKSFDNYLVSTVPILADFGTKPLVETLHKRFKYWTSGQQHLPSPGSDQYILLQMQFYEQSYLAIVAAMKDACN